MNQGLIPQRYALALYKTAVQRGCAEPLYAVMKTMNSSFISNPDLERVMQNPFISAAEKKSLLLTAAGVTEPVAGTPNDATATLIDFIKLLEQNKRIEYVRGTVLAYIAIYRKERNISTVTVTSAQPLNADASERLKKLVKSQLPNGIVEYDEKVDPSLIGGFTIAIDNKRLDASIKNELKQLRLKLLSH